MNSNMEQLKEYSKANNVSFDAMASAAGMDVSTFYRKVQKGPGAFTVGELQRMVSGQVMTIEDAIRIFLS